MISFFSILFSSSLLRIIIRTDSSLFQLKLPPSLFFFIFTQKYDHDLMDRLSGLVSDELRSISANVSISQSEFLTASQTYVLSVAIHLFLLFRFFFRDFFPMAFSPL